jgi:c-di-AMP phosphodiesterase-like protein
MNKQKLRKGFIYLLLAFLIVLYLLSFGAFFFGQFERALHLFAYTTFFSIITYFLIILQRRTGFWNNDENED